MNLYDLTQEAIQQVGTYKYPEIDQWKKEIDKILAILKEPTISNDKVESIYFDDDELHIKTSYSVRCCECSNDMSIPIEILQNENPIKQATQFQLTKELNSAQNKVDKAQKELDTAYIQLEQIKQTYNSQYTKETI